MRIIYMQTLHEWKNVINLLILISCISCCHSYINVEGRKLSISEFNPEHQNSLQYNVNSNLKSETRVRDGNYKSVSRKFVRASRQYDTRDVIESESFHHVRQLSNNRKLISDDIFYNKENKLSRSEQLYSVRRFNEANDKRKVIQKYSLQLDSKTPGRENSHFSRSLNRQLQLAIAQSLHSDHNPSRYTERFNKHSLKYRRLTTIQYNNNVWQNRFRLHNRLFAKLENYRYKELREYQINLRELTRVQEFNRVISQSNIQSRKNEVNPHNLNKNNVFNFVKHVFVEFNKNELHAEDKFLFMTFISNRETDNILQITKLKVNRARRQVTEPSKKRNRIAERKTDARNHRSDLFERKNVKRQARNDITSSDQRQILNFMSVQNRQIISENSSRQKTTADRRQVVRNKMLKNHTDRTQNLNKIKGFRNVELKLHLSGENARTVNFRMSNDMPNSERNNLFHAFQSNNLIHKLIMNQTNLFTEAIKHILLVGLCALYASSNFDKKNTFLRNTKNRLHLLTGV